MRQEGESAPPAPAPDWSAISDEILCPLCDYNLRGLIEPRCPECGYRFAWAEVLDRDRRKHPYLFEHHPERNIRSFFRTAFGGLAPWKFWRTLRPQQPSRPRRLIAYWVISVLLFFAALAALDIPFCVISARQAALLRTGYAAWISRRPSMGTQLIQKYGSVQAGLDAEWPLPPHWAFFSRQFISFWYWLYGLPLLAGIFLVVVWPWLTFGVLVALRASMRQRIRSIHVLRCVLYSFDYGIWLGAIVFLVDGFWLWDPLGWQNPWRFESEVTVAAGSLLAAFATVRLAFAYHRYLHFRHAVATVLCSQLILLLLVAAVIVSNDRLFQWVVEQSL